MAGLQDFLLYQAVEQQNQAKNPLFALAQGVGKGIEEERLRMKEQKQAEEDLALQLKFDESLNTNAGVINTLTSPTINKRTVTRESGGKRKVVNTIVNNPNYVSPIDIAKEKRADETFQQNQKIVDLKIEEKEDKIKADKYALSKQNENEKSFAADMLSTINEVEKGLKYFGAAGSIPPFPGEYKKVNWKANYEKLVSKQILETISSLKSQSKTGATGFGQLSEKELAILTNASTVLKRNMSEEDALRYLNQLKPILHKIQRGATPRQIEIQKLKQELGEQ